MSALEDQTILREAATRVLGAHGLVLEEVEVRGGGTPQVRLIVDLPEDQLGSADLDTVAEASRELSEMVDADDALLGSAPCCWRSPPRGSSGPSPPRGTSAAPVADCSP